MNHPQAGFCGDYCGKCPNYPHECPGCISELHPECYFVQCCQAKGIAHCGFCEELPCEKLRIFVPDDSPGCPPGYHIENLKERRAIGTEAWLQGQRER